MVLSLLDQFFGSTSVKTAVTLLTPANNSGALGLGVVSVRGDQLSVGVAAAGLTPGEAHPFYIHGFPDGAGTERLALVADDLDGDGFVETPEGERATGPALVSLTRDAAVPGEVTEPALFPVADALGRIALYRTYTLDTADPNQATLLNELSARLGDRVLEFHGLDLAEGHGAGTAFEVNGAGGYNPLAPTSQGQLIELPEGVDLLVAAYLQGNLGNVGAAAGEILGVLLPYSLSPRGPGLDPVVPEPAGMPGTPGGPEADSFVSVLLPSSGSGVLGTAAVRFDEAAGTVQVKLDAHGLTPGQVHPLHIHGFSDDRPSLLPNIRLDADRDGFVEAGEGEAVVGPVILALTEDGSISAATLTANFPSADAGGHLRLEQTYRFDFDDPAQLAIFEELRDRMTARELQLHGLDLPATQGEGTQGEVNGTAGYKIGLPVAHGILLPVGEEAAPLAVALTEWLFAG